MENLTVLDENRKAFADRLSAAMGGMTNRALAIGVGVSPTSINEYCAGSRFPGADVAWAIACFLGVSSDWLLGGKGPMRPDDAAAPAPVADNPEAQNEAISSDVIAFCAKMAGATFELAKTGGWLRDLLPDEFAEFTEALIEIESAKGVPAADFKPNLDAYRKMLSAKK